MTTLAISTASQMATALSVPSVSSGSTHKAVKNAVNNVRPGFPVSLPLAYPPPQFAHALLAAQTFQQIRPPRLPMTHFGGTFPPAQSTWGPFPVRPLSPARATNSSKPHTVPRHNNQNSSGSQVTSAGSLTSSPTATTSSAMSTVPGSSTIGHPGSPSVRRQLFVTVVKTSNSTTITTTASNNSTTSTNTTYPFPTAKEHYPVSSTSSPSPPAHPPRASRSSPLECVTTPPSKGTSSSEQEGGSPPVAEAAHPAISRPSNCGSGVPSGHSAQPQTLGPLSQETRPLPQQPQVPSPDPRMGVPPNLVTASSSSVPGVTPANPPATYPLPQPLVGSTPQSLPAKLESATVRPPSHGANPAHKNSASVQNSSVAAVNISHVQRARSVPSSVQVPSPLSTQSASQNSAHPASKSMAANFSAAALPFGPFSALFENSPASAHAFWGGSVGSSQTTSESGLSGKTSFLPNSEPLHPLDTSKAPGFRPPLQRPAPNPSGKCLYAPFVYLTSQFVTLFTVI